MSFDKKIDTAVLKEQDSPFVHDLSSYYQDFTRLVDSPKMDLDQKVVPSAKVTADHLEFQPVALALDDSTLPATAAGGDEMTAEEWQEWADGARTADWNPIEFPEPVHVDVPYRE